MPFEWDLVKADSNYKKHGVDFYEAMTTWSDENGIDLLNLDDSQLEERWIKIGYSIKTRLLVVVYSEKNNGEQLRIISVSVACNFTIV
ncbi:MAG: BrnT family toxin [Bacteriovorax sp.]|nr:BrnT family toxin [Bacteriovorax sp.]